MKAVVRDVYGPPEILQIRELPEPSGALGDQELLVEVHATSVTTAEWRMRAGAFPPGFATIGRLMVGWSRPRNPITGRDFAGRVLAVGRGVTRLQPGQAVFGANASGANVERMVIASTSTVAPTPRGLSPAEAAALPFGGITAMWFLQDAAKVREGERVLVLGGSGGVGVYAVQLAKHLRAEVTAVASAANHALLRELGADHVIDYHAEDALAPGRTYDVVVDTVGVASFGRARPVLSPRGRYVPIEGTLGDLARALWTRLRPGPTVVSGVALDTQANLERLAALVESGAVRPVVGHRFPLAQVVQAHRVVDGRRRRGAVILELPAYPSPDVRPHDAPLRPC